MAKKPTKKVPDETLNKRDQEHILKAYDARLEASREGQHFNHPLWDNPSVRDDHRVKYMMTFWGSLSIASNCKPIDIHVTEDEETSKPLFIVVAGNTDCDIVTICFNKNGEIEQSIQYEKFLAVVKYLDEIFIHFYNKPTF
tara:strand:- start:258 stop:680 length:423 start_codon:yes stop_codon:yes gene_type:complete